MKEPVNGALCFQYRRESVANCDSSSLHNEFNFNSTIFGMIDLLDKTNTNSFGHEHKSTISYNTYH